MTRKPSYSSFFSVLCPDLKNVFFGKIHWAPSEVLEVKRPFSRSRRPNFGFHLFLMSFHLEFSFFLGFEVIWPQQPRRPQKGLREFFQKLHFWNQCVPRKKMRCVTAFWSKFSLNLSTEEVCCIIQMLKISYFYLDKVLFLKKYEVYKV